MKKISTLIVCMLAFVAVSNAQSPYVLSPATYSSSATVNTTNITFSFSNGVTVLNTNTKGYSTGSITAPIAFSGVKFSALTQYTVTFPASINIDSINFNGYDNYSGKKSYFSEVNGATTTAWNDSTQYFLTAKTVVGTTSTAVMSSVTFKYPTPLATSTFTFTPAGNQMVVAIKVYYTPTVTGLENIVLDENKPTNVYTIDGRRIKTNVLLSKATEGLQAGIYIINNKKVAITKEIK